jgi:glycosyltransferase involved in cell wall biosynthesis
MGTISTTAAPTTLREPDAARIRRFCVITPEYLPAPGGVAGYIAHIARGLSREGDEVDVFSPEPAADDAPGVRVHALPQGFDARARRSVERCIAEHPRTIILLQYVPGAIGGVNPSFVRWVTKLDAPLWVMFHEVVYPFEYGQRLELTAYAAVTRAMAAWLLRRAERVLVSTPGWERFLLPLGARTPPIWMPVTSNVPTVAPPAAELAALRATLGIPPDARVVGHFSTFNSLVTTMLGPTLRSVLARAPGVHVLLLGRNSRAFATTLDAEAGSRVHAAGELSEPDVARALSVADVLLLPFPDGVTGRRTTMMAALGLGKAVVTNAGEHSESVWFREGCVALTNGETETMAAEVLALLEDPARRDTLARRALCVYEERFAVEALVPRLRALASVPRAVP